MSLKLNPTTGNLDVVADHCECIKIKTLDDPTWKTQCQFNNLFGSAGQASGGIITKGVGETVNVSAGTGFIKATDSDTGDLLSCDWAESLAIAIPTNTTRYIGIEYVDATSPPIVCLHTTQDWDLDTHFPLGSVINLNGVLYILNNPWWITDGLTNLIEKSVGLGGYLARDNFVGGLTLGVTATRHPTMTKGTIWGRTNEFEMRALDYSTPNIPSHSAVFDVDNGSGNGTITDSGTYSFLQAGENIIVTGTSDNDGTYKILTATDDVITTEGVINGTDGTEATTVIQVSFSSYWFESDGTVHETTGLTQYPVTQWNDIDNDTLTNLLPNKYANWWVILNITNNELSFIYPSAYYSSAAAAEAESVPSTIPGDWYLEGMLIGKIVIKTSQDAPVEVQSVFTTQFTASLAADHGNLTGLSDDDHEQYPLLVGRSGGQTLYGSTLTGENLILKNNAVDDVGITIGTNVNLGGLDLATTGAITGGGSGHDQFSDFVANEHIDWTTSQAPVVIHADNYTDTNTQLSETDIATMGFTKDIEVDWTTSQSPAVIHADNYTDTNTQLSEGDISTMGFTKDVEVDWTVSQAPAVIHTDNYTDTTYSASDFNHDDLANITGTASQYNHPTDAQMTVLGNTSNTNTGDQSASDFSHNSLSGLNDGTDYEHITQTQKTALHDKYTDAESVSAVATADDYLKNDASDTTTGTLTAAGFTTTGTVQGEHIKSTDDVEVADSVFTSNGATGTPAYSFTNDTNTGMWLSAADTLNFSTGGSERLEIDSTEATFTTNVSTGSSKAFKGGVNWSYGNSATLGGYPTITSSYGGMTASSQGGNWNFGTNNIYCGDIDADSYSEHSVALEIPQEKKALDYFTTTTKERSFNDEKGILTYNHDNPDDDLIKETKEKEIFDSVKLKKGAKGNKKEDYDFVNYKTEEYKVKNISKLIELQRDAIKELKERVIALENVKK